MHVYARSRLEAEQRTDGHRAGFAFGEIDYGGGHNGQLLYLKPSFLSRIPADVRSYGAEHKAFPHESTLDQWFSESQFESYRMLGRYQMMALAANAAPGQLQAVFDVDHGAAVGARPQVVAR